MYEALIERDFELRLPVEPYGSYIPPSNHTAVADAVTPTGMRVVQGLQALLQGMQQQCIRRNRAITIAALLTVSIVSC